MKHNSPYFSIIVPVYKSEKYISICVNSILKQSFTDFELLLIDDGSPDNSAIICDQYSKIDKRIKTYHKENGGVSSARNLGLKNAIGEYIIFVDSDDFLDEMHLSLIYNNIKSNDMLFYGVKYISQDGKNIIGGCLPNKLTMPETTMSEIVFNLYKYQLLGFMWSFAVKREIIEKNNIIFDECISLHEDALFCFTCMIYASSVSLLNIQSYNYRINTLGLNLKTPNNYTDIALKRVMLAKQLFDKINLNPDHQNEILSNWKLGAYIRKIDYIFNYSNNKKQDLNEMLLKFSQFSDFSTNKSVKAILLKNLINNKRVSLILLCWNIFRFIRK